MHTAQDFLNGIARDMTGLHPFADWAQEQGDTILLTKIQEFIAAIPQATKIYSVGNIENQNGYIAILTNTHIYFIYMDINRYYKYEPTAAVRGDRQELESMIEYCIKHGLFKRMG